MIEDPKFKSLVDQYLDGKATDEESAQLMEALELMQRRSPKWDQTDMGDEQLFRNELYSVVKQKIAHKEQVASWRNVIKFAAILLIACAAGILLWHNRYGILNRVDPITQLSATTTTDMKQLQLADGTRIWINTQSRISYPEKFRGGRREITLQGEAFFEVAHDPDRPFIVHAGKLTTQVLGTSFNISAYNDDQQMAVTVVTGKVGVMAGTIKAGKPNQLLLLTPHQQAVYHKSGNQLQKLDQVDDDMSWRNGKLVFDKAPLPQVVKILQRRFGLAITYDNTLNNKTVSADFTGDNPVQILKVLAASFKGSALPVNNGYYISTHL